MSRFRFAINVTPKPGILDPQGRAVEGSLGPPRDRRGQRGPRRPPGRTDRRCGRRARPPSRRPTGSASELLSNPLIEAYAVEAAGRDVVGQCRVATDMAVRIGVVVFPGSNCDRDTVHALEVAGAEPVVLWHEQASLDGVAAVILPGGFAYGDYVRAGVIARFSPVMRERGRVRRRRAGWSWASATASRSSPRPAWCPGALLRNRSLRFAGREVAIAATRDDTPFTRGVAGRPAAADARGPRRGLLLRRRRDARPARARRPGAVPVRRCGRRAGRAVRPGQSQRLAAGDRRRPERGRQRRRPHAPPGAGRRGDPGLGRRDGHHPLARRQRRGGGPRPGRAGAAPDDRSPRSSWSRSIAGSA